jgi:hypothetical protein
MGKLWWCLVAVTVAGACQVDREGDQGGSAVAPRAGASSSNAGTTAGVLGPTLDVGGTGGSEEPIQPSGTAGSPDLSGVVTPVVHCHPQAVGGQNDGGESAAGGAGHARVAPPVGGAPVDDACSPPPSVCVDGLTLVYFDQGECVAGRCEWVKQSLMCRNLCRDTGCQDSITTK